MLVRLEVKTSRDCVWREFFNNFIEVKLFVDSIKER